MRRDKDHISRSIQPAFRTNSLWKIISQICLIFLCVYFVRTSDEEEKSTEQPAENKTHGEYSIDNKTALDLVLESEKKISPKKLRKILFANGIIPDCIDTSPNHTVQVKFYHGHGVYLGNEIPPTNITSHSPHLVTWPGTIKEFFTLIMVDLDEPQRLYPDEREWLHWLIVNIPGSTRYLGELKTRYVPPDPQDESGLHRYVFVVYKQPEKLKFEGLELINGTKHNDLKRGHFSCRMFAKKYELGEPWAINFFQSQFHIPPREDVKPPK